MIKVQIIQFSIRTYFCLRTVKCNTVLFQTIQFCISIQFSPVWPIDRTLSGATTPDQSRPGSDSNERVQHLPQSSSITGTSPSDCLVPYPGQSLARGFLPLCRVPVDVFYSPSRLGNISPMVRHPDIYMCVCVCNMEILSSTDRLPVSLYYNSLVWVDT